MIAEILKSLVVLHDDLDVSRRDRNTFVLDEGKSTLLFPVHRQAQLHVGGAFCRAADHLQRCEQLKHAERHLHPLRHSLQETLRRLVLFAFY